MPNHTPNINLVKPLGSENYDISKVTNDNADTLDAFALNKMTYKGTVANVVNLPSTNQKVGDFYYVSSITTHYVWTGTEWRIVGKGIINVTDVNGLQTALDGKLSLTGGTLTGALNGTTITTSGAIKNDSLILSGNSIIQYSTNGLAEVAINYSGYQGGTTQFRNTAVFDGKNGAIATFTGSDKSLTLNGNLNTNGQIKFPATQNPSADANTLDDYEEGTWTPTVGGTATYTTQQGTYIKIGKLVFVKFFMIINVLGTGSTGVISGLPFTVANAASLGALNVAYFSGSSTPVSQLTGHPNVNATSIDFRAIAAGGASYSSVPNPIQNGFTVYASATYESAS